MKKKAEGTPNGNTKTQLPLLSNAETNGEDAVAEVPRIPPETPLMIAKKRILAIESAFEGLGVRNVGMEDGIRSSPNRLTMSRTPSWANIPSLFRRECTLLQS
jgi:hypothetical protein